MIDDVPTVAGPDSFVNFDAPAVLRKWPSLNNQRRIATAPYSLLDGTLDECTRRFMAKAGPTRQLYVIHTAPQPPLVSAIMSEE